MDKTEWALNGHQIYLRRLNLNDVGQTYLGWLQDDEVMEGIATSGYTMSSLRNYVSAKISDPDVSFFAICDVRTDEHIGNVKLDYHDPRSKVSELGLLIGNKKYWGKGVGSEACRLAMK